MKSVYIYMAGAMMILVISCRKFVDTPVPKNELVTELVFSDDKTATASVVGMYSSMNALNYQFANVLTSYLSGMQADELYYASTYAPYEVFSRNELLPNSQYVESMWVEQYRYIYQANACIEGITAAPGITPSVKSQLLGEAYFMRAFLHFYLVNMYGDVPLITGTDYQLNNVKPRESAGVVYDTITNDLKRAQELLGDAYPGGRRNRPNKAVATALLARVYLYKKQWALAEQEAGKVLSDNRYELLQDLNSVFLADSREAIWQLQSVNTVSGRNTWEGFTTVPATPSAAPLFRLDTLQLIRKFEAGDKRLNNWTGKRTTSAGATYYYPFKYKVRSNVNGPVTENSMVMRIAEQLLIRAEARIQQNKLAEGKADLDAIRARAGLPPLAATLDKAALLLATEQERKSELFIEWGHRWFDLKRTGRSDAVLGPIKTSTWQSTDTLYPIPSKARSTNINLTQNNGYN